jgi:adenylylsulfate kinase
VSSRSANVVWHEGQVDRSRREELLGQKGVVLWFTGLSGSGKSTIAYAVEARLAAAGHLVYVLDGDNVRHGLNANLGFSAEDRAENIRRIGEVARLFIDAGVVTLASFVSPYRSDRDGVRQRLDTGDFLEVYVNTPLAVCEARDPKGLYRKARAGEIPNFTGISDPYEAPTEAELEILTDERSVEQAVDDVMALLRQRDKIPGTDR